MTGHVFSISAMVMWPILPMKAAEVRVYLGLECSKPSQIIGPISG
jgi:hypothetical protein